MITGTCGPAGVSGLQGRPVAGHARPGDLDVGEMTDKGYLNQRQVLGDRAAPVELIYGEPPPGVIVAERTA